PPHAEVVHHLVLKDAVGVDDEESAQGKLPLFDVDPVGPRDATVIVTGQWEMERSHTALLRRRPEPLLMGRHRVGTDAEHLATAPAELRDATAHGGQLGGSDEGKVARVEKQGEPAVEVVVERNLPRGRVGAVNARKRKGRSPCADRSTARCHRCLLDFRGRGCSLLATFVLRTSYRG